MEPLIVGIDPGNTSAVAALDLEGEVVLRESRREFSHDEIIKSVIEEGKPIVITSDRKEMPSTVDKIASSLGAEKFEPEDDLSSRRKNILGEGENSHEKDAHASALHAFKQMRKSIEKIQQDSASEDRVKTAEKYLKGEKLEAEKNGAST